VALGAISDVNALNGDLVINAGIVVPGKWIDVDQ
jgi:hypothetical protein